MSKNDISAKAATWTTVYSSTNNPTVLACKATSTSGRIYVKNPTDYTVQFRRPNTTSFISVAAHSNSAVYTTALATGGLIKSPNGLSVSFRTDYVGSC